VPARVVDRALACMDIAEAMLNEGAPDAMSDACMAAICARGAAYGAYYNVRINAPGLADRDFADGVVNKAAEQVRLADEREAKIRAAADARL